MTDEIKKFQYKSDFIIEEVLGSGQFGTVNRIEFLRQELKDQYGPFAALKQINSNQTDLKKELITLSTISSDYNCPCKTLSNFTVKL